MRNEFEAPTPTAYEIEIKTLRARIEDLEARLNQIDVRIALLRSAPSPAIVSAQPSLKEKFFQKFVTPCALKQAKGDEDVAALAATVMESEIDETFEEVKPFLESSSRAIRDAFYEHLLTESCD